MRHVTCMLMLCAAGAAGLPPLPPVSEPAAVVTNAVQTYARTFVFDDAQAGIANYLLEVNGWRTNSISHSNRVELVQGTNVLTVAAQRDGQTSKSASLTYVIQPVHVDIVQPKLSASLGKWGTTNAWPAIPFTNTAMGFFSYDVTPTNVIVEGPVK